MTVSTTADYVLDCSGLACPMPILKTSKAVNAMAEGEVLKLIATDPGSMKDIDAWTRKTGHLLLYAEQDDGKYIFYIRKMKAT